MTKYKRTKPISLYGCNESVTELILEQKITKHWQKICFNKMDNAMKC